MNTATQQRISYTATLDEIIEKVRKSNYNLSVYGVFNFGDGKWRYVRLGTNDLAKSLVHATNAERHERIKVVEQFDALWIGSQH